MQNRRQGDERNFVAPFPRVQRVEPVVIEPWPSDEAAALAQTQSKQVITGTPEDVARGFAIAYTPFALSASFLAALAVAVAGGGAGFAALAGIGTLSLTWLAGFVVDRIVSVAGGDLLRVLLGYRLLRHEQKHRHGGEKRGQND